MLDFILEIGTEELPSRFLNDIEKELVSRFSTALNEAGLNFNSIYCMTTPRRAALFIEQLAEQQEVHEETFMGPAQKVAFDAEGKPSKATEGFTRGHGMSIQDIFTVETEKGIYIAIKKNIGGLSAKSVLETICPAIITAIPFPKKMRWGTGNFAYARPLHWILALLNDTSLNFTVANITSSDLTYGHRIHGKGECKVSSTKEYLNIMQQEGVIINPQERRSIIINLANQAAERIEGTILWKESLLNEVQGLVELPVPLMGEFDKSFLELPKEVLLTSMESHQKSFGVANAQGKLLPYFLTILNVCPSNLATVKKGWERVLRARLEDARFFWKSDNHTLSTQGFTPWLEKLDKVIFLGPLGSMGDKTRRLEKMMSALAPSLNLDPSVAAEAGRLSKADLVSAMVGEFDTLQGIMGGIYAEKLNKPRVAQALAGQYLPAGPETPVPTSDYAALLSLCDKADTLVGCFGLNNIPTGTADPYALRRSAIGIARILRDKSWNLSVAGIFTLAQTLYTAIAADIPWKLDQATAFAKLQEFYIARVKNLFISEGNDILLVEAILNTSSSSTMPVLAQKLEALTTFSKTPDYTLSIQSFKRIANIIRKQASAYTLTDTWNSTLLQEDAEKELTQVLTLFIPAFNKNYSASNFSACFTLLADLRPHVDLFFESTMIMAEDIPTRQNRLNILNAILIPMSHLADFAALQM